MLRISIIAIFVLSSSCQSQSLLPFSDLFEMERTKSLLTAATCDELIEKATDKSFSLRNLAAIRAAARCKDFQFDEKQLSDFERKLYVNELSAQTDTKTETKPTSELSTTELKDMIKKESDATQKFKLYRQLRSKLKRGPDRQQYVKSTSEIYKWALKNLKSHKKDSEAQSIFYESAQLLVRTYWTEDDIPEANKILKDSLKRLKDTSVAELLYLNGRMLEESQKTEEAISQYDLILEDIKKHSPKGLSFSMDRLLWLKAWVQYKDKKYDEAEKGFAQLIESTQDLSEKSKAQFFQARCLKFLGKDKEASTIFQNIAENDFFGYYGLVSYHELGKKLPAINSIKKPNSLTFDLKLNFLKENEKDLFTDLVKYKELNLAERAVSLLAQSRSDEVSMTLYMTKKNQTFLAMFRVFSKLDNNEKIDVFTNYPDIIFPQPYPDQVKEMAEKTNIPSSLIYSIMKQESAFNERARSPADAMGLMQVIPKLAKQISKKFDIPYRNSQDLYDPNINIQVGSFELMEQVKKQNGQLSYVAAAYNAGPGALANWLKNRKRDDILEFIEEIPYDETKTYVKLIARNKLFYERISNRDEEHPFPADFLN